MKYDLVFEGGGAKGMAFVGAFDELVRRGHGFNRLLGTSAGAINAVLLAAGYTPDEMLNALNEKENGKPVFISFMGEPSPFSEEEIRSSALHDLMKNIDLKFLPGFLEGPLDEALVKWMARNPRSRHFFAFVERGGWFSADRFVSWLQSKLDTGPWKNGQRKFSGMTFRQFYEETAVALSVVASDTTGGRLLVLNQKTAPGCPIVWAVRMSMSIPLVWDEVIWQEDWGMYLRRPMAGHVIVDGGMLSNFPIELFISDEPQVTKLMGAKQNSPVLGMLIDEALPVPHARGILVDVQVKPGELKTVKRFRRLIETMIGAHDKMVIEEFEHLVVRLPAAGYGTTEFDMSDERRASLIEAGRRAMGTYLDHPPGARATGRGRRDIDARRARRIADRIATRLLSEP
jgi:predicted acylesterase/phospholipase RssA